MTIASHPRDVPSLPDANGVQEAEDLGFALEDTISETAWVGWNGFDDAERLLKPLMVNEGTRCATQILVKVYIECMRETGGSRFRECLWDNEKKVFADVNTGGTYDFDDVAGWAIGHYGDSFKSVK